MYKSTPPGNRGEGVCLNATVLALKGKGFVLASRCSQCCILKGSVHRFSKP